jgi:hypothetical protein
MAELVSKIQVNAHDFANNPNLFQLIVA